MKNTNFSQQKSAVSGRRNFAYSTNRIAAGKAVKNQNLLDSRMKRNGRRILLCIPIIASFATIGIILKNSSAITLTNNPSNFILLPSNLVRNEDGTLDLKNLINGNREVYYFDNITSNLPSKYDLTKYIKFSVGNQSNLNTCAFFAANHATESSLIMDSLSYSAVNGRKNDHNKIFQPDVNGTTSIDLSERYLDYLTSTTVRGDRTAADYTTGANSSSTIFNTAFTALELYGTPAEVEFPYDHNYTIDYVKAAPIAARVRSVMTLPDLTFPEITDETTKAEKKSDWLQVVKYMISHVSAVAADLIVPVGNAETLNTMIADGKTPKGTNYDPTKRLYYYNEDAMGSASNFDAHAVTLVGWDDTFGCDDTCSDGERFVSVDKDGNILVDGDGNRIAPKTKGAFIALNSWGENWGDDGYFYISYESEVFLRDAHVVIEAQDLTATAETYEVTTSDGEKYELDTKGSGTSYAEINDSHSSVTTSQIFVNGEVTQLTDPIFCVSLDKDLDPNTNIFLNQIGLGLGSSERITKLNVYLLNSCSAENLNATNLANSLKIAEIPLEVSQTYYRFGNPIKISNSGDADGFHALAFKYTGNLSASRVSQSPVRPLNDSEFFHTYYATSSTHCDPSSTSGDTACTETIVPVYAYFQTGTYIGEAEPDCPEGETDCEVKPTDPDDCTGDDCPAPSDEPVEVDPSTIPDGSEPAKADTLPVASADESADKKAVENSVSAPNTGENTINLAEETSSHDQIFLPSAVIVIFGSLLAYDLVKRH